MNEGRVEQAGPAKEVYDSPRNVFVADFLNLEPDTPAINLLEGALVSKALEERTIGIRPEDLSIAEPDVTVSPNAFFAEASASGGPAGRGALTLRAEVVDVRPLPLRSKAVLCLRAAGQDLYLRVDESSASGFAPGSRIVAAARKYHLFDRGTGLRVETVGA